MRNMGFLCGRYNVEVVSSKRNPKLSCQCDLSRSRVSKSKGILNKRSVAWSVCSPHLVLHKYYNIDQYKLQINLP